MVDGHHGLNVEHDDEGNNVAEHWGTNTAVILKGSDRRLSGDYGVADQEGEYGAAEPAPEVPQPVVEAKAAQQPTNYVAEPIKISGAEAYEALMDELSATLGVDPAWATRNVDGLGREAEPGELELAIAHTTQLPGLTGFAHPQSSDSGRYETQKRDVA